MHKIKPSSERVAPGRLNLARLLPLVLVFLFFTAQLLPAQASPTTVQASYSPASPVNSNQVVTLSATVTDSAGVAVTLGTVSFYEGGTMLNTVHVNTNGVATLNYLFPPSIGPYRITARYNGSAEAGPATSPFVGLAVLQSQTVSLASSGSSSGYALTATVSTNNSYPPGGQVTFIDTTNGQTLGTADLKGPSYTSSTQLMQSAGSALGDFNGDGRIDWVDGSSGSDVRVYLTNGPEVTSNLGRPGQTMMAVGDFNNDGETDLVFASTYTDTLSIWLSQGNGNFSLAGQIPNVNVKSVTVGDFNNDGNQDLLVQLYPADSNFTAMEFFAGDGAGNMAAGVPVSVTDPNVLAADVADYNNDGYLDFFSLSLYNGFAGTSLYLGTGDGATYLQQPQSAFGGYPPPSNVNSIISGKFCNTENLDIAYLANDTSMDSTLTVLCGDGTGNFNPPSNGAQLTYNTPVFSSVSQYSSGPQYSSALIPADINADGQEDIVAFGADSDNHPAMVVFTNTGSGFSESAAGEAVFSAFSTEGPQGYSFTNTPVAFSTPILGAALSTSSPYWLMDGLLATGTSSTTTATLYNVVVPDGSNVIATYSGTQSNTIQLAGGSGGTYQGPTISNLAPPNGSATVNNGVLQLTDGGTYEAGSAFWPQPVDVQSFATTFTFQLTNAQADGFTFTVQNNSPQALGAYGGELGYGAMPGHASIENSVALKFDLFDNASEGNDSTGVYPDGANPDTPATDMTSSGVDLHSGDVMQAQIIYDGANLHLTLTDTATNAVFQHTFAVNIPQTIGSSTAYVGFTGATGALAATQQILSWTYEPLPYYPDFSTTPSMLYNGGATKNETSLLMIAAGVDDQANSAWFPNPLPINQFTTDFTFSGSNIVADGFTFTIQNAGPGAVGPAGGGLGYGPDTPGEPVGISNSMAIKFDFYDNQGEGNDSTGIYTNGDSPTVPAIDLSSTGINLHSTDLIDAHMVYDGSTITMTLTDTVTGATWSHYFYGVNLPQLVGGSTAYVGFTGGTGALTSDLGINSWTYLPSSTITSPVKTYFGQ